MDLGENLREIEKKTMAQLKDFQCATVERINELFRDGQNRVLVADEVGLGKTLIARGAIAKTAIIQYEKNDDIFKIVYICSNQVVIASFIGVVSLAFILVLNLLFNNVQFYLIASIIVCVASFYNLRKLNKKTDILTYVKKKI